MKRVLIITYYWPPSGGSGVQRWLKFAKYLPQNGWQPIIYCPENADYTILDSSLEKDIPKEAEILKSPIFEPYRLFRKITGQKEVIGTGLSSTGGNGKSNGLLKRLMIWVRGNFFIPDARMFWIKPSIRRLKKYLVANPVDAIVSTGPPHSCHLIALGLKKHFPHLKWISDFRDPWTTIDFIEELRIGKVGMAKHRELESKILLASDKQIVVTPTMLDEFKRLNAKNVHYIANGYDTTDYDKLNSIKKVNNTTFTISHIGTLPPSRDPKALWKALKELMEIDSEIASLLHINFVGKVDQSVKEKGQSLGLGTNFSSINYVPHNKISSIQQSADLLLLIINDSPNAKGILTGKLFEYLASKKPILCIAPADSDAARVIDETQSGKVFSFEDVEGIKNFILGQIAMKKMGIPFKNTGIEKYARHNLTKEFVALLESKTI